MSLLWFLLIIGISILVHELGHYWAARVQGVNVRNFALGFGPTLLKFDRWGTTWRLNSIPLGGYAEIDGMLPGDTHGYSRLHGLGKFAILVGGVVMNLLLAWTLMGGIASVQGIPENMDETKAQISDVIPGSLAERSGFKAGDKVISLNGQKFSNYADLTKFRDTAGEKIFGVERDGQTLEVRLNWDKTQQTLGVRYGASVDYRRVNFFQGFAQSMGETFNLFPKIVKEIVTSLAKLFGGQQVQGLSGPVGIVNASGQAAQAGSLALILLLANINLSLAVFNLLPIPGLDGGRIFVLLLNALSGNRIRPDLEARLAYGGFIFMILLIVMVTINDIRNLNGG